MLQFSTQLSAVDLLHFARINIMKEKERKAIEKRRSNQLREAPPISFFHKFHWVLLQSCSSEREGGALTNPEPLKRGQEQKSGHHQVWKPLLSVTCCSHSPSSLLKWQAISEKENNSCISGTSSGYSHPNGCKLGCMSKICCFEVYEKHLYSNSGLLWTV